VDLDCHIEDIVKLLHFEDLRRVILVGHSYGGMVITGAADRATDRVGHLVYLDAATPADGQSLVDMAGPYMAAARADSRIVDGVELCLYPSDETIQFYGVIDPEQIAWMKARLTPHPWRCFEQPIGLTNEDALGRIPPDAHQYNVLPRLSRRGSPATGVERASVGPRHRPRHDAHRARMGGGETAERGIADSAGLAALENVQRSPWLTPPGF
jgi:pimeloyl-ACP methyl ester carboxylesterase